LKGVLLHTRNRGWKGGGGVPPTAAEEKKRKAKNVPDPAGEEIRKESQAAGSKSDSKHEAVKLFPTEWLGRV